MKNKVCMKRKFVLSIILLCIIGLGIGYSYLSQELKINNTVNYGSMKWNVRFDYVEDYTGITDELQYVIDYFDAAVLKTYPTLSDDAKSINFNFNFGNNTKAKFVFVKTAITNDSSFDVAYNGFTVDAEDDVAALLNNYLGGSNLFWLNDDNVIGDFEEDDINIGDVIKAGETKELLIIAMLNELFESDLPSEDITLNFSYNLEWVEVSGFEVLD